MTPDATVDLDTACRIARVHDVIIKLWCIQYGIGHDTDSGWLVSRNGLQQVMRAQIRRVA